MDESPYGVRDMTGNVIDWCADMYREDLGWRSARGGAFKRATTALRSAVRHAHDPAVPLLGVGFRVVAVTPRKRRESPA